MCHRRVFAPTITFLVGLCAAPASADMIDMTGVEPQHICAECHGLDGSGNRIKFPRLAGQDARYIVKQLGDFRGGHRNNDGGQMQESVTEVEEKDVPKVAEWFSQQEAPFHKPTFEGSFDLARAEHLATKGIDGRPGCLSCHSVSSPYLSDGAVVAPRIAGQYDYYIAKQLKDFRDGRRRNDPDGMMTGAARRLSDAEITALAVFLSQRPELHEAKP